MQKYLIKAANKKHLTSLIKDYRQDGFNIVTYTPDIVELETETAFITLTHKKEVFDYLNR